MKTEIDKLKILVKTGFFHIFGGSVINKIIAFLSSIVLVQLLSKTEYGLFTYAWNIYCMVLLANGLGIDSGILQMCSEKSSDEVYAKKICNYGARLGIFFDVMLGVVLLAIGMFAPLTIEGADTLIIIMCCLPIVQLGFNLSTVYLRSQKRNKDYATLSVLNTVLVFGGSVVGVLLFREKGMVLGHYIAYILCIVVAVSFMKIRIFSKSEKPAENDRKALLSISAVSMCNNGLSQLLYLLGMFVLGIVVAEETVLASYKVATIIPSALTFIPASLITYLYPYFAEHKDDGEWCLRRYRQIIIGLGGLNAVISILLFAGAPLIVKLLFGYQYLDAVPVLRILAVDYFFSGTFRTISGNLLVTQRKLKFNLLVALVSGGLNIITGFFLIQWWGSVGAAIATISVGLVASIMSTTYLIYTFIKQRDKVINNKDKASLSRN